MNTATLSTDQAPPLNIPLSFYAFAPLALVVAGTLLAAQGTQLLTTHWLPHTIAWVHLGTLGFLGAVMLGSLYQMVPVVIGAPVPAIRVAHGVALLLALGTTALVAGLTLGIGNVTLAGAALLLVAVLGFLLPVGTALLRAAGGGATRTGMRGAVLCLLALVLIGVRLAWGHATGALPEARTSWLAAHVALGLIGWVGGLLAAVSWQVVPMFYLTQPFPATWQRILSQLVPASTLLAAVLALVQVPLVGILLAALPAAIAVWLVQPILLTRLILQRRRRRRDPTLRFWWLALACSPLTLTCAVLAFLTDWPPASLLFGFLAILGWAGAIVHGMLTRIVPFLTWFHRFTAVAGLAEVPPMKQLLPDAQIAWNWRVHTATVVTGTLAILTQNDVLARLTGGLLSATGLLLAGALVSTLLRARPTCPKGVAQSTLAP